MEREGIWDSGRVLKERIGERRKLRHMGWAGRGTDRRNSDRERRNRRL